MPNKLLIVDDYPVFLEGLKVLLSNVADLEIIDEAEDGETAVHKTAKIKPDLVLMDLTLPGIRGTEVIRLIKQGDPNVKVIALSEQNSRDCLMSTMAAGADGYILKEDTMINLLFAIKRVLAGQVFLGSGSGYKLITGRPGYYVSVKNTRLMSPERVPFQSDQ